MNQLPFTRASEMALFDQGDRPACRAIGADAGGSKLLIHWTDGERTQITSYPSVNARTAHPEAFAEVLADGIRASLDDGYVDDLTACCVGAAGAGGKEYGARCASRLAELLDLTPSRVSVQSDARIALKAAFPSDDGIIIIAGTGSGCYGLDANGTLLRSGGWGPGLEDPGSGNDIGKSAIKRLLSELESGSLSDLGRAVAGAMSLPRASVQNVLDTFYDPDFRPASLAPLMLQLLESGDAAAVKLIEAQCLALARQASRLPGMTSQLSTQIALTGGLTGHSGYVDCLRKALLSLLPAYTISVSTRAPVEGAMDWALKIRQQG